MEIINQQIMKNWLAAFLFFGLISCGDIIEKPVNVLDKQQMAEAIAELAINDQLSVVVSSYNPDVQTRYTFQHLKIDVKNFNESYKYYVAKNEIEKIYEEAQQIILNKDPKAKDFISRKIKEQEDIKKKQEQTLKKQ